MVSLGNKDSLSAVGRVIGSTNCLFINPKDRNIAVKELLLMTVDYQPEADGSRYWLDTELFKELDGFLKSNLEEMAAERGWRTGRIFAPWDRNNEKPLLTIAPAGSDNPENLNHFFAVDCGVPSALSAEHRRHRGLSKPIHVNYRILQYVDGEYKGVIADFVRSGEDEYIPEIWARICMNIVDAYWIAGDVSGLN